MERRGRGGEERRDNREATHTHTHKRGDEERESVKKRESDVGEERDTERC